MYRVKIIHLENHSSPHLVLYLLGNTKLDKKLKVKLVKQNSKYKIEKIGVIWCKINDLKFTKTAGEVEVKENNEA